MAEEVETKPTGTEPVEQPLQSQTSESLDSLLASVPGLEKYFGAESEEEKPVVSDSSGEEVSPSVVESPDQVREEAAVQEEETEEKKAELPPSVQKRIDKLTAQKHSALEKAEALEARVKELEALALQAPPEAATPENPLGGIDSGEELNKRFADAQRVKLWALENLDGGEVSDGKGGQIFLEGARVRQLLALSEALLTQHIPERRGYLQAKAGFDLEVKRHYPNVLKAGTEEAVVYESWVKLFPAVRRFPDYQLIIMDALAGQKMRLAKAKAANGAKPPRVPTLAAPSPSSGAKTQPKVLSKDLLARIATDRDALDIFSESLIGTGSKQD